MAFAGSRGWRRACAAVLVLFAVFLARNNLALGAQHRVEPESRVRANDARSDLRGEFLELMNADRDRFDRRALGFARRISRYATRHSRLMAERGELFHSTSEQLREALDGTGWVVAGENIGTGESLQMVERAFMRSGPHRRNVLRRAYDQAAVGIVESGGEVWITVVFYGD